MKKHTFIAAMTSALLAAGCNNPGTEAPKSAVSVAPAPQAPSTENAVAIVNGKPITKEELNFLSGEIAQRRGGSHVPEDKILEEMIKRELLSQEATAGQLTKDPKFAARMENAQRMVLSQIDAENFISKAQVSDDELKQEYDRQVGATKQTEYKARHILVDSEKTAKDAIAKLKKGEKFADLAKKLSKDPGSKDKGGDLGWFNPKQMVPPFSEAVVALKNGETTQTPVQSQFGWHVIMREDSREQTPPPFDTVKDRLRAMLQTKKLQDHLAELQKNAKIENRLPPAKPEQPPTAPEGQAPEAAPSGPKEAGAAQPAGGAQPAKPAAEPKAEKPAEPAPEAPAEKPQEPAE